MDRRQFLKTCLAGAGAAAGMGGLGGVKRAEAATDGRLLKAELKLGSQEGRLPGGTLHDKIRNLQEYGGTGIEIAAGGLPDRVKEIRSALAGTSVQVSAICAAAGPYIVPDADTRRNNIENAKVLLSAAADLRATGVILVPAFNSAENQLSGKPARDLLLEILAELGAHAEKVKSRILLEPLNRGEAFFLRQLADAASICRDVNSPGVAVMGDFYHMFFEETSDRGAFISAGGYLHHVHLGSRKRLLPGQDDRSFIDGFRGLKEIGYRDFVSLECGCKGKPEEEIPKSFRFLEKQWKEART